jgi:hypothetical protein
MAGEILYSGLGDLRLAESLSTQFLLLLADRNWLGNHPALFDAGDVSGTGSTVVKIPQIGLDGYDAAAASSGESGNSANVALTDASITVTVARQTFARETSGLAQITDPGFLTSPTWANDAFGAMNARMTNMITALMSGFATSVGSTGVNFSLANLLAAKAALAANNALDSQPLAILASVQMQDLMAEIATTSGGAAQFAQASQDLIAARGIGFQGSYLGMDFFSSNRVPTANAGADYAGGVFTRGAIVTAFGTPFVEDPSQQVAIGGRILFERDRTARTDLTAYVSHFYFGVAEGQDLRGVAIVTDA